jgi:hypothetical protein
MIKLFEEFNVESLYWVITEEEFDLETDFYENLLPFSEKEILKIREFNLKIGNQLNYRSFHPDIEVKRKMYMVQHIQLYWKDYYEIDHHKFLHIYKSDDNYYYVIQNRFGQDRLYYKCDEMEGLFNCIMYLCKYHGPLSARKAV